MAPLRSSSGRSFGKLLGVNRSNDLANDTNSGASSRGQLNSRYVGARAQINEFISPLVATGGTKITTPTYVYHVFEYDANPQSFIVQAGTEGEITYLVIGGGGGGSNQHSGGGGAGGLRTNDPNSSPGGPGTSSEGDYKCIAGTYTLIVGQGGSGAGPGPSVNIGSGGGYSSFNTGQTAGLAQIRSEGGGGGGNWSSHPVGGAGGSGGGNGAANTGAGGINQRVANTPGTPTPVQGYPGGTWNNGATPLGYWCHGGGGGGGAGAAGGNLAWTPTPDPNKGASGNTPGAGGAGRAVPAFPGPVVAPGITIATPAAPNPFTTVVGPTGLYAGGGAGGLFTPRSPGNTTSSGGTGGGGNSNSTGSYPPPGNSIGGGGVNGCGGGGGGSGRAEVYGGAGGHGVIMIRYAAPS